jgi:probable addiction module antidote protein
MEKVTFAEYDGADYIETKEDAIAFLEGALEEGAPEFLLSVIGDIARSKGMAQIAREFDLDREGLYKLLSPKDNPPFTLVVKMLDILGFRLRVEHKAAA